jgi:hypothetical protein
MSPLQCVCKTLGILSLIVALPTMVSARTSSGYVTNGVEYAPAGSLPGDQIYSAISLNKSGGYLVWEDNITDGDGYGVSAVRLDSTFSPMMANFRINLQATGDQEQPRVALLNNGGAAIVWQGGQRSFQHIYAAFLSASNIFVARDVPVNVATNYQSNPVIATLTNGNVVVAWASRGQDNADGLLGVYARLFNSVGTNLGGEFLVNQYTPGNQRTPAVAALSSGNFVVAWVSELERSSVATDGSGNVTGTYNSVDIYARVYNPSGTPLTGEFLVNTTTNVCADPSIAGAADGTFIIAWSERNLSLPQNGWDISARMFSATGAGGNVQRVNTQLYGDQYAPKIASVGTEYLVAWTSMGQDGSRQGVFGQFLNGDASMAGGEFRVNTTVINQQEYPAVTSDQQGRFMVVWSSYVGGVNSMDLYAQRYATYEAPLSAPAAPMVSALDSYTLSVAWAPLAGFSVANWELYVDTNGAPVATTNIFWQNQSRGTYTTNAFAPDSTHTFQLAYVLTDGRTSPLSSVASGKTWGPDLTGKSGFPDGLPDDWETLYWGTNRTKWLTPGTVLAPNGTTVWMVFLWGANPNDPTTWLTTQLQHNSEGWFLSWNTVPGEIYQVQSSPDLLNWTNLGSPRFAAGTTDSIYIGLSNNGYYQVMRPGY